MTDRQYPNVRLRLRRTSGAPGRPAQESMMTLWLDGTRFHLRDESGRSFGTILADVTAPRGLGQVARTMESFMDAWTPAPERPTDMYADLATGRAVVAESDTEPWVTEAARLVGLADQVIADRADERADGESPTVLGRQDYLGRNCVEDRYEFDGEEDGVPFRTVVTRLVLAPYVVRREVKDDPAGRLFARTEVLDLAEGVVTDADLVAPSS